MIYMMWVCSYVITASTRSPSVKGPPMHRSAEIALLMALAGLASAYFLFFHTARRFAVPNRL